ncbi:MAG: hypothetical protein ACD_8C00133G0020 [uncultured bacterium]|nr:MAG: hypothetical protein ACD_8C00133G0020 [uncultured bacterium]
MIVFSAIMPHPPMSIPGIGTEDDFLSLSKTLNSFESLRVQLEASDPDTIIIISPHAQLEEFAFVINSAIDLNGSLSAFGKDEVYTFKNNIRMADKLDYACLMNEVPAHLHENVLDHGALIPLYHLTKNIKPKVVHLAFSMMSYEQHYRYGQIIQGVVGSGKYGRRIAVIASGDLSHKLTKDSPAGYFPGAEKFDHDFIRHLGAGDLASLVGLEEKFVQDSAECGVRSIMILLGILHGKNQSFKMLSYEAPFGIGYLTGYFE